MAKDYYKELNKELDIFNDAKFGSKYVTRDGLIALYLCDCILVLGGTVTPIRYNHRGVAIGKYKGYDIIGKYNLWYKIRKCINDLLIFIKRKSARKNLKTKRNKL